jgi:hypothetical protein
MHKLRTTFDGDTQTKSSRNVQHAILLSNLHQNYSCSFDTHFDIIQACHFDIKILSKLQFFL